MRILLASQQYPPETAEGGIGTQTYIKAHGLARLGHDVCVVSHSGDDRRHEYRDGAVAVTRIPGFDSQMPLQTTEAWWATYSTMVAAEIASVHRRSPLDLVDFPEYGAEGFTWLLNRVPGESVPTVIHLHGSLPMLAATIGWPDVGSEFYRTATFMEGTCIRLADAVFSSSACSADWCARSYDIGRDAISIIHTGIDTTFFSPSAAAKAQRPTVIFVGRLAASKGVDTLVDAIVALAPQIPGLQLRLVGRGEPAFCDQILARASAMGHPDLIDMHGYVDRRELPALLAAAHLFAAPSVYEGGPGFVYLEAMACGLPVIACAGSGAAEVVAPGENGFLIAPGDSAELARALSRLLGDAGLRENMGARGRQHVVDSADSEQCLRRLEQFYRSVAMRPAQAAP
jgi:glycosyltransferase involved in cell wall biosynthesis